MAIVDVTDWKAFLSPNSDLPPDVSFLFNNSSKTVRAHRQLLGAVSRVFRHQFFGKMKDEREEIKVEMATAEAFQTMIDFIYRKAGQDTFTMNSITCPQKLFEVMELSERYQVWDFKTLVNEALQNFVVTRENMIFAATVARNYKVLFEDISLAVSIKCLKFLHDTTKNSEDMFALIGDTMENFPGASLDILLELKKVKDEKLRGNVNKLS